MLGAVRLQDDAVNQSLLFDISDDEPVKKKGRSSRRMGEQVVASSEATTDFPPPIYTAEILGQVRDLHECADTRCKSQQFDIIDDYKDEWKLECMICGTGQWVTSVPGILPESQGQTFTFRDGIFEGRTIDDAAKEENGMDYIEWAACSHKRAAVQKACRTWLDSRAGRS